MDEWDEGKDCNATAASTCFNYFKVSVNHTNHYIENIEHTRHIKEKNIF